MKNHIASLVAMAAAMAAVSATYPVEVEVHNNHWRLAIEPETSTEIAGFGTAKVVVRDEAQMQRLLGNLDALRVMSALPDGVGMTVHFPYFDPAVPVVEAEGGEKSGDGDPPGGEGGEKQPAGEPAAVGGTVPNFAGAPEAGGEAALTSGDAPKDPAATPEVPMVGAASPEATPAAATTTPPAAATPTTTDPQKTKRGR